MGLLLNWLHDLGTVDKEKTDVSSIFLASDFTNKVSQAFVLRGLPNVLEWLPSIFFEALWRSGEVHSNRKKAGVAPIFKEDQKFKQGNCRPVSLASVPWKIIESVLWEHISGHRKVKQVTGNSQHRSTRSESCLTLTNLIAFCDKMTCFMDW